MARNTSIVWLAMVLILAPVSCRLGPTGRAASVSIETLQPETVQSTVIPDQEPVSISVDYQTVIGKSPVEYGTNGWWTDQDADLWRTRYAQLAPVVVRLPLPLGAMEPQNDDADPDHINYTGFLFDQPLPWFGRTVTFRAWLEMLRDLNVTIMLQVPYMSNWLSANGDRGLFSTYPPNDLAEYREFLLALLTFAVDEVGYPPEQVVLEPVNEPDLDCGQDPNVPCFWENWQMDDLVAVMRMADQAAGEVDPEIRIVGVSECCGTQLAERLMNEYDGQTYLDGFTYHRYVQGMDFSDGLARGQRLASYGKPVYLNEYGNTGFWSNGDRGALWHAVVLPEIWQAGINPLQFPISEFPGSHEGYEQLGLFTDWEDGWKVKPAYWVYSNFYRNFGGSELVSTTQSVSLSVSVLAGRKELEQGPSLALWLTHYTEDAQNSLLVEIVGFPVDAAQAQVYDNFQSDQPMVATDLTGRPLRFLISLPPSRSCLILVQSVSE